MSRIVEFILPLFLVPALLGCATTLPSKRPADLTIKMTRSGVQAEENLPIADEILLSSTTESHYRVDYEGGGSVSVMIDVEEADLDEMYETLRANGFDRLSAQNGHSMSGPGTYVTLEWQGQKLVAHLGGVKDLEPKVKEKWDNVVAALKGYKKTEIEMKGVEVPVKFDPTVFGAGLPTAKNPD